MNSINMYNKKYNKLVKISKETEETHTQFSAVFATCTNHKQKQFQAKIHLSSCWKHFKYNKTNKKIKTTKQPPQHI